MLQNQNSLKASFLGHFIPSEPIAETRLNVSKPQDVKSTDMLLSGPMKTNDHPTTDLGELLYHNSIILPHSLKGQSLQTWLLLSWTRKAIDPSVF